ncbi:MAG: KH domain-containing protein [Candidatus Eisenbacteria bacterium]|uniref:KH domain-containing protein n=1 Tax=Eiseniibacteriota bacterium TaxID=2212470 RepID=A0A849SIS0_UNCEI|nr:KH domain-containing protein [Candidatus Eisenbacteria bacterium]
MTRGLVDHPDDVRVEILEAGQETQFELHCSDSDRPHVIGKQGRTVRALRLALDAAAARIDRDANLEIAD